MRICLIFNPAARGEKAKKLQRHLDAIHSDCTLKRTWAEGTARALASEAVREGFDAVIATGGDGTLNEVINGVADEPGGLENVRVGVLPSGTVNVFAREYRIPIRLRPAWEVILGGHTIGIDLPEMKFQGRGGGERRFFAQLAGAGLDARAVELVNWKLKKKAGSLAYVYAGFQAFCGKPFTITADTGRESATGELVLIGNGRFYGGSFPILGRADPSDGLIDACVFPKVDWPAILRTGWACLWRQPGPMAGATYLRAPKIRLTSNPAAPVELDGEFVGHLPATCEVNGRSLKVIVPQRVAEERGEPEGV